MEPEARYAWVGVAVLALVALLAAGLYWLTGGTEQNAVKRYTVYFQQQSLEGMQIGSDVRMQGVKVGKVVDYAIMPNERHQVRVVLEVDARTPVLEGAEAVVTRHLVTGLAAIDLANADTGKAALQLVPEGEDYPVLAEGVPQLTRVADTLQELGRVSRETLLRVNQVLSDDNQKALSGSLTKLDLVLGDIHRTMPEVNATLAGTRQAAERLGALSDEAGAVMREAGTVVREAGTLVRETTTLAHNAGDRIDRATEATEATLATARTTLQDIDREMRGLAVQLRLSADLGVQEIQATGQSLRLAGEALQAAGRGLAEPERVLFGPNPAALGPGEKKP